MAVGKNKKLKTGRKGAKKKIVDPFSRKEWYDVMAPAAFKVRNIGKTVVNKTQGTKVSSDFLKNRVYTVSLADLNADEDHNFKKMKLRCEDVQGHECLTSFYGMQFTTDKLRSMVRKWHTLVEAFADVKTTDGYVVRMFCIGFTSRRKNQLKKTSYTQSSQARRIRRKMVTIMQREAEGGELKDLVNKLIPDGIGKQIEKACQGIYPLQFVYIRKVKMLKMPKFDANKLLELHTEAAAEDVGNAVDAAAPMEEVVPQEPLVGDTAEPLKA